MRRDGAGAEQRFQPEHHARGVLDQILVSAGQLLQRCVVSTPVIDRAQPAAAEELGELVGIDLIPLVPLPRRPAPITDDDPMHQRRQDVVQPLRLGPFLEGHVHRAAHPADKLREGRTVGRQHAPGDHPPALLPHRGHRSCLVDVQRDILDCPFHESRSLLWTTGLGQLHGSSKGRTLNMR
jgi:hypothetical protein